MLGFDRQQSIYSLRGKQKRKKKKAINKMWYPVFLAVRKWCTFTFPLILSNMFLYIL